MAAGTLTIFDVAREKMLDGGFATTDTMKVMLITSATVPTQTDATPVKTTYTEVTAGGNYTAGGNSLGTWANFVTRASAVVTLDDTAASQSWAQNASNPTNARYAVIYNSVTSDCLGFVDLGATIDMTAGDLTITWNASGIVTIS